MDIHVEGKKVLIRLDLNVPINPEGTVEDLTRLKAALPTIKYVLKHGGSALLLSHLGRPQRERKEDGSINYGRFTLEPLVKPLSELLKTPVQFSDKTVGDHTKSIVESLTSGDVLLLENSRFYKGEKEGSETFARALACLADVYINDAFGTAHRDHASTSTVAKLFPKHRKSFGLLMEKELREAGKVLKSPDKPFTIVIGGAKVADKIGLLESFLGPVKHIVIGGGMAYTFIKASGGEIGDSLVEEDKLNTAEQLLEKAQQEDVDIHLPEDSIIAESIEDTAETEVCSSYNIPEGWLGMDIGPEAIEEFSEVIHSSKTLFWNGPMGIFEMESFANGTKKIAEEIGVSTARGAYSLVGGGDSASALNKFGLTEKVSYVSTGGGAMLALLRGDELPAVRSMHGRYE